MLCHGGAAEEGGSQALSLCPTAEDTMLFVIQFFLIGFKSASFAYAYREGILLEERWEWKWFEKHPERERERKSVV